MAVDRKLKKLAIDVAKGQPVGKFSYEDMHEAFRAEVAKLVCNEQGKIDFYKWEQNSKAIFALMGTMVDEILPTQVYDVIGQFADIKTFSHGDKPRFTLKKGRQNVKRFVTRVAAAGVYERVRLDRDYFDMEIYAHGGAVYQSLEGFLAGRESLTEVFEVLLQGLEESIYADITTALQGTIDAMPAANKKTGAFDASEFNKILATVRAYGQPTIFCTQEFAADLQPDDKFIGDAEKSDMRNQGYIGRYSGADVVILPQSFTDKDNVTKVIDPQYCYIMPGGASAEKPVKVAFEGDTLIRQMEREDWSAEIQMYKKMGTAILNTNHYGMYKNTALA